MTDTVLLEQKILNSGKKKGYLANKCNLSRAGFRNCVINKAEFTSRHIAVLCEELGVTSLTEKEAIFFARNGS